MIRRYLYLLLVTYKCSLMYFLEYRLDFLVAIFRRIINLFLSLFMLNVIFLQTPQISGWNRYEVFIIYASFLIVYSSIKVFVDEGLSDIPRLVRTGELDFFLTKPVNSRFLLSVRHFSFASLFDVVFGIVIIVFSLKNLQVTPSLAHLLMFVSTIVMSVLIFYSLYFFLITFSIKYIRLDNLRNLFSGIMTMARVPTSLYGGIVGFIFTFFIPLAFVSLVPTQALLNMLTLRVLFIEGSVVLLFNLISAKFWQFALRYYTSASS